jgi:hypothetical protein
VIQSTSTVNHIAIAIIYTYKSIALVDHAVNIAVNTAWSTIAIERERFDPFIAILYDLQHGKNSMVYHSYKWTKSFSFSGP